MPIDADENSYLWTHFWIFQMSEEFGRRTCKEFYAAIKQCYMDEFLCLPTAADIKSIIKFHKSQHNFDGIFGLLDCTHTDQKTCPKAWHGAFKGITHWLFWRQFAIIIHFWHAFYRYVGTLNDQNILKLSPFIHNLTNGTFEQIEKESNAVPFLIEKDNFHLLNNLNGIHPNLMICEGH